MKKLLGFALLLVLLVGCSNSEQPTTVLTDDLAIPFEIVKYEEKIAPVYNGLVPHIAYAKTEGQLQSLKDRFKVDGFDMDMDEYFAVFIVVNSDSCGIAIDSVYDRDSMLSVQMQTPNLDGCDVEPMPHTFVLKVAQSDYTKVQLYVGEVIKSSMEIKE